ncbi:Hypothetical predicted protein [Olea europaea subsp. europaea]|uniref:DUF4220 domain-containing protein n=1 Tax=Olea europaea subsp. europaea TaxID=158383 RepID=A0A8S0RSB6_OLEEU|nr:Hypothetical predicted protein [Olea europaea subsp. europaea]
MTVNVIPKRLQRVWDKWNIRGSVLASLCLQILLIFLAPSRKRARGYIIIPIVWTSYLLADFVAAYAIGLISNNQGDKCDKGNVNDALSAFWASFLLLHLGGPDSITAFSLEDNELWIRHLFGLIAELIMVVYVFTQAIPFSFWLQTLLVLLAGLIKYAERTRALYLACLGNFKDSLKPKPDAGPNYAQLMGEYSSMLEAELPVKFITVNESERQANKEHERQANSEVKLNDIEIVREGFRFYQIFRGLIVDHMFSFQERDESRRFFLGLKKAQDAFRVMEVELNFMYDALFTKMATVYKSYLGYIFRFICTALIVATYILFQSHHKPHIHPFDIAITYSLLIGAIILDIVALIKLVLSDWTLALLQLQKSLPLLKVKEVLWPVYTIGKYISFRRRWSESMGQHNLISFCLVSLERRLKLLDEVVDYVGLKEIFEFMTHRDFISVGNDLKEFIFNELKAKADEAKDAISAREIHSSRGHMAVLRYTSRESIVATVGENVEFNESVLKWHIATDLLYFESKEHNDKKKLCKQLSDYMLYLLFMQPSLMSAVSGIFQIRFQDTCEEAKEFVRRLKMTPDRSQPSDQTMEKRARAQLLELATPVKPVEIKGDRSKSVLFDACMLAKDLKSVDDDKMWKMMSEVLVELLSYGASHCRGNAHAQQLTKGGELVTFVWLLMAHFGLGDQFRIQAGHARAKLITETEREMSEENTEKESAV